MAKLLKMYERKYTKGPKKEMGKIKEVSVMNSSDCLLLSGTVYFIQHAVLHAFTHLLYALTSTVPCYVWICSNAQSSAKVLWLPAVL